MSTRALVFKQDPQSPTECVGIYVHFDGYPRHVGKILSQNYTTPQQLDALIAMGDASSLEETLETSKFYHRDFNEDLNIRHRKLTGNDLEITSDDGVDYVYLFTADNTWKIVYPTGANWDMTEE